MKKLIITKKQMRRILKEENINISAQAKTNSLSDFASVAGNGDTQSDIRKAGGLGSDVSLTISGPDTTDNQPQQQVNVANGQSLQDAVTTQANDTLIRNGGSLKLSGDGIKEEYTFKKRRVEEARLAKIRRDGNVIRKKDFLHNGK